MNVTCQYFTQPNSRFPTVAKRLTVKLLKNFLLKASNDWFTKVLPCQIFTLHGTYVATHCY